MKIEEDPELNGRNRENEDQEQPFFCRAVVISNTRILVGEITNDSKKKVSSNMMKLIETYFSEVNEPYSIIWWKIEREDYPKVPEDILEILYDLQKDSTVHADIVHGRNKYLNRKLLEDLIAKNTKLIDGLKTALDSDISSAEKKDFYTQYLKHLETTQDLCVMKIKEGDDEIEEFLKTFSFYGITYKEMCMLISDGIISPKSFPFVVPNDP